MDDFENLQVNLLQLHRNERFAEALELLRSLRASLTRGNERGPVATRLNYWEACLLARLGEAREALQVLELGREFGQWWSPARLLNDPDLEHVRALPGFQRVLDACERLRARAQQVARGLHEVVVPEVRGASLHPTVLALHTRGSSLTRTLPHWRAVTDDGVVLAVLQSAQVLGPEEYCWDDATASEDQVAEAIREISSEYPLDTDGFIVGGAEQGARLAVGLAMRSTVLPLRGFIAIGGAPDPDAYAPFCEEAAGRGVRGVFIVGENDPIRSRVEEVHALLSEHALALHLEVVPGADAGYPAAIGGRLRAAVRFVLGSRSDAVQPVGPTARTPGADGA